MNGPVYGHDKDHMKNVDVWDMKNFIRCNFTEMQNHCM